MFKSIYKTLGYVLSIASIIFIGVILFESRQKLVGIELNSTFFLLITLATGLVLLGHFNLVVTWIIQLRNKYDSNQISFKQAFTNIGLSQIAKYLPGNFAHLAGRVLLANKNISKKDVSITLLIESSLLVFSALIFGYYWSTHYALPDSFPTFTSSAIATVIISIIITYIILEKKINTSLISYNAIVLITAINSLSFFIHGIVIYLISYFLLDIETISLLQYTSGFAISFLIGYILPGAPGGIGVREYAFTLLFTPFMDKSAALEIIIIYRIISVLSDLGFFSIAYYLSKNDAQMSIKTNQ